MIRWRLAEIIVRHKITSKALAGDLEISRTALSNLKNSDRLPELGSSKHRQISDALSRLTGKKFTPFDLMGYTEE